MDELSESILFRIIDGLKTDPKHELSLDTRLLEDAGLDSLALVDLIAAVEVEMHVRLLPEDYAYENLYSVRTLMMLIEARRKHR